VERSFHGSKVRVSSDGIKVAVSAPSALCRDSFDLTLEALAIRMHANFVAKASARWDVAQLVENVEARDFAILKALGERSRPRDALRETVESAVERADLFLWRHNRIDRVDVMLERLAERPIDIGALCVAC
jgi:hypothetical protein